MLAAHQIARLPFRATRVRQVATELIEHGKVARGWLGVSIQEINSGLAEKLGLDRPMGALITSILEGTPAAEFGLQKGDVIVSINGEAIKSVNHLPRCSCHV